MNQMFDATLQCDREKALPELQRARGEAVCTFRNRDGRTVLDDLRQSGSFKVRLPKQTVSGQPEAVLINTAGGLTDGDRMSFRGAVADDAEAVFTTQASERAYASRGGAADVVTRLSAGRQAKLAWLPQETILFDTSALHRTLDVDLAADSVFLAHESVVFGRTAMGEAVSSASFRDTWRVRINGKLIHADAVRIEGDASGVLARAAVLDGCAAMATVLLVSPDAEAATDSVRDVIETLPVDAGRAAASTWQGKLLVRAVAGDGFDLRRLVIPILTQLNSGVPMPRVWSI